MKSGCSIYSEFGIKKGAKAEQVYYFNAFFKDSYNRYWLPSKKINSEGFKLLILDKNLKVTNEIDCPIYNGKKTIINYVFETENKEVWGIGSVRKTDKIGDFLVSTHLKS